MMEDIYIAAHLRRCLRHSVIGHVLQHTPSTSILDALHLHHAVKSPPLCHPSPSHRTFIEAKNEPVKTKHVFQMKENIYTTTYQKKKTDIDTPTIMYQAKFAGRHTETIMYPANFAAIDIETIMYPANFPAPGRGLDLLLPSFLPSREEKKKQERRKQLIDSGVEWHTPHTDRVRTETKMQEQIFYPLWGHAVGRMQYAPTSFRQETLYLINSQEERIETKMQEQKNHPSGSRGVLHTPHMDRVRIETKMQEQIFCPLWGHAVGRMPYAPTSCRQETLFPINSREERIETKIQEQKNRPLGSRGVLHTPHTDRVRTETKTQEQIFCPLRGHVVGRMQYAPTSYQQETLSPINSQEERIETEIQKQKSRPLGSRGILHTPHTDRIRTEMKMQERRKQSIDSGAEWHTPHTDRVRIETKMQEQIFCPLRGHVVGRMQYAPTSFRQEMLFPINSREERTETKRQERIFCPLRGHAVGRMQYAPTSCRQEKLFPINFRKEREETEMQEQKNHLSGSRGVWHTPHTDRVRIETKKQERIFCPLRGHSVGRMQYAPTTCRQETLFPINSREERIETKMQERRNQSIDSGAEWHTPHMNHVRIETKKQEQKNHPLGSRGVSHTPSIHPERDERKSQERISCPLRGHAVGRMQYAPTSCRQETLYPINSQEERTETKMQERRKQSIDSGAEWHTPFMHQGKRDAVWREAFLEQRARVAIWRDRRLEEKSSHARLQLRISGENSKPYKSSLVALSEQLRDIFAA